MFKSKVIGAFVFWITTLSIFPFTSLAQEKIDGTVVSTNLISCGVVPGKVGTCEGTLVLERKIDGKPHQVTVTVTRDTTLKKGEEKMFLFQLKGAPVTVTFASDKGEKAAQSVIMKSK